MSLAPTRTVGTPDSGTLSTVLVALVLLVLLLGVSAHVLALIVYG